MAKRGRKPFINIVAKDKCWSIEDTKERMRGIENLFPETKSKRGIQNWHYHLKSFEVLEELEGVEFLLDRKRQTFKKSLLVELGRIGDKEIIKQVAIDICNLEKNLTKKQPIKEWEKLIRQIRLDKDYLGIRFLNYKLFGTEGLIKE